MTLNNITIYAIQHVNQIPFSIKTPDGALYGFQGVDYSSVPANNQVQDDTNFQIKNGYLIYNGWYIKMDQKLHEPIWAEKLSPYTLLDVIFDQHQKDGMPFVQGEQTVHLQCRPLDMTNWGNLLIYLTRNEATVSNENITVMTRENVPIVLTGTQTIALIESIQVYYNLLYSARWQVRYQISQTPENQWDGFDVEGVFDTVLSGLLNPVVE
jgi:hypothetical protein